MVRCDSVSTGQSDGKLFIQQQILLDFDVNKTSIILGAIICIHKLPFVWLLFYRIPDQDNHNVLRLYHNPFYKESVPTLYAGRPVCELPQRTTSDVAYHAGIRCEGRHSRHRSYLLCSFTQISNDCCYGHKLPYCLNRSFFKCKDLSNDNTKFLILLSVLRRLFQPPHILQGLFDRVAFQIQIFVIVFLKCGLLQTAGVL